MRTRTPPPQGGGLPPYYSGQPPGDPAALNRRPSGLATHAPSLHHAGNHLACNPRSPTSNSGSMRFKITKAMISRILEKTLPTSDTHEWLVLESLENSLTSLAKYQNKWWSLLLTSCNGQKFKALHSMVIVSFPRVWWG
jgi:hypothetical protein